jgi:uncharacterized membrane protein YraQ (UPF0718 family)
MMLNWKREWKKLALIAGVFLMCFYLPIGKARFDGAVLESLRLLKWYAREHVLLCLVPAFFIAGAIAVFVSQASVIRYFGAKANKILAYGVASIAGAILAVCSCTVLPLFAGIYRMGAGLGPATTFLYSGPAINILAIILTARVLGLKLGIARALGAIVFSIIIGLLMQFFFRKEEKQTASAQAAMPESKVQRPLWQTAFYFFVMVTILVFANWGKPVSDTDGVWHAIHSSKWIITSVFSIALAVILVLWFGMTWWKILIAASTVVVLAMVFPGTPLIPFAAGVIGLSAITSTSKGESGEWFSSTWGFAKQIMPLLFAGVLVAGLLLGSPESTDGGLIPSKWISKLVGGNSLRANLFASVVGAFMYFATLTEVLILQGLINNDMGQGPALGNVPGAHAAEIQNYQFTRYDADFAFASAVYFIEQYFAKIDTDVTQYYTLTIDLDQKA